MIIDLTSEEITLLRKLAVCATGQTAAEDARLDSITEKLTQAAAPETDGRPPDAAILSAILTLGADIVARMGDDPDKTRIAFYSSTCRVRGPEEGRRFTLLAGEGAGAALLEHVYEAAEKEELFSESKTL